MTKRLLSLVLALVTVFALLAPVAKTQAATEEDFESIVTKVYDEFAASIHQDKADEKAIDALLEPAIYGNGSALVFGKQDAMTAALYESAMFREIFIKSLSNGIATMQDQHRPKLMIIGNSLWYDFRNSYSIRHYRDEDFGKEKADDGTVLVYYDIVATGQTMAGTPNKCDNAFSLVVGEAVFRFLIEQTELTAETVTYRVAVRVKDDFDFDNSYSSLDKKGYNTTFAKLLTLLGPLLGLKNFHWSSETELTITVPNTCTHSDGGKYRWEKIGEELVNVTAEGLWENASVKQTVITTNEETGASTTKYYYKLDQGIDLRHDAPWSIEFETNSGSTLYLGPERYYTYTQLPQFYKTSTRINAFENIREWVVSPKTGKNTLYNSRHMYGVNYVEAGAPKSGKCVYRIENRIAADGTNNLWLLVNGEELGTLSDYTLYKSVDGNTYEMGENTQWCSGKDFIIRYIYNLSYYFTKNMNLFWLEIDTGSGYQVSEEVPSTCTQGAGTKTTCILCGLETLESTEVAVGHTSQVIPGKAATCHETGLTDGAVCTVCGEVLQEQTEIPMLTHEGKNLAAKNPTCLEAGLTEGSVCALCGDVLVPQEAVPALGHVEKVIQPGTEATCLFPGTTEAKACDRCGKILQTIQVIPPLGHTYENGKCVRCGTPDPEAVVPGDADEDGTLSFNDALLVLRCAIGLETLPPFTALACDVDGDGQLTYNDALIILRASIGL